MRIARCVLYHSHLSAKLRRGTLIAGSGMASQSKQSDRGFAANTHSFELSSVPPFAISTFH